MGKAIKNIKGGPIYYYSPKRKKDVEKKNPTVYVFPKLNFSTVKPTANGSTYSKVVTRMNRGYDKQRVRRLKADGVQVNNMIYENGARLATSQGYQNVFYYGFGTSQGLNNFVTYSGMTSNQAIDLWLEKYIVTYRITNSSNENAFVEFWDGYYRRPSSKDPVTLWSQGLTDLGLATSYPATIYGTDPLKSRYFTQFCRVTNVTRCELGEGRSHQHKVVHYADAKYNSEISNMYGSTYDWTDVWARFTMIILRGGPVHDSTTPTNVGAGKVSLDIITTARASFMYQLPASKKFYYIDNTSAIPTPTQMNPATGTATLDVTS